MLKSLGLWKNVNDSNGSNGEVNVMIQQAENEPLTGSSQHSTPNCDKNLVVPGLTPTVVKLW